MKKRGKALAFNGTPPRDLLVFPPRRVVVERASLSSRNIPSPNRPPVQRQIERLGPQFGILQEQLATFQANPDFLDAERVIVIETAGPVQNFFNAVERYSEHMQWLGEYTVGDAIVPDDDFFYDGQPERSISGTFYLTMSNSQGLRDSLRSE